MNKENERRKMNNKKMKEKKGERRKEKGERPTQYKVGYSSKATTSTT